MLPPTDRIPEQWILVNMLLNKYPNVDVQGLQSIVLADDIWHINAQANNNNGEARIRSSGGKVFHSVLCGKSCGYVENGTVTCVWHGSVTSEEKLYS